MHAEKAWLANLVRLELLDHVVQESIVKVFATQEGVTIGGLHLKNTACRHRSSQAHTIKRSKLSCHITQLCMPQPLYGKAVLSHVARSHSLQVLDGNNLWLATLMEVAFTLSCEVAFTLSCKVLGICNRVTGGTTTALVHNTLKRLCERSRKGSKTSIHQVSVAEPADLRSPEWTHRRCHHPGHTQQTSPPCCWHRSSVLLLWAR